MVQQDKKIIYWSMYHICIIHEFKEDQWDFELTNDVNSSETVAEPACWPIGEVDPVRWIVCSG
jgi:hypothetical protein